MAERRMFAKSVVESSKFMKLNAHAKLLYFNLGMDADDDGYADAITTLQKNRTNKKYLNDLESAGLIQFITDDPVVKIVDWTTNNQIRRDRYHPSRYAKLATNG